MEEDLKPENGGEKPPEGQPQNSGSIEGQPQNTSPSPKIYGTPYEPPRGTFYEDSPYFNPQGVREEKPVHGKPIAIAAFVLAVVAFICFGSAATALLEMDFFANYYVMAEDELWGVAVGLAGFALAPAAVGGVLSVFAHVSAAQNVKEGNPVKFIRVFAILASVLAGVSILGSLIILL